ncbi:MAG: GNAT family N-acetyltransferase [Acidimicrobiia bacterium]
MARGTVVRYTGDWPGTIVLRHGLSKAVARPWNADVPDAHLTMVRGSSAFLEMCVSELLELGAPSVMSPPLPSSSVRTWSDAGFEAFEWLDVFGRDLALEVPDPDMPVNTEREVDWAEVQEVDSQAFEPFWRLDSGGLSEAATATPAAVVLTVRDDALFGFSIVGAGASAGYLQRLAVAPSAQHRGIGRALVRASIRWARHHGAHQMLLNTLGNNDAASNLYLAEGFTHLDDRLAILRSSGT